MTYSGISHPPCSWLWDLCCFPVYLDLVDRMLVVGYDIPSLCCVLVQLIDLNDRDRFSNVAALSWPQQNDIPNIGLPVLAGDAVHIWCVQAQIILCMPIEAVNCRQWEAINLNMPAVVQRARTFWNLVVCMKSWGFLISLSEALGTATSRFIGFSIHLRQLVVLPRADSASISILPYVSITFNCTSRVLALLVHRAVLFEMRYLHDEFQFLKFSFRQNGYSKQHICQGLNPPRNSLCPERILPHFALLPYVSMTFIHTDRVLFRNNIKSVGLLQRKVLSLV